MVIRVTLYADSEIETMERGDKVMDKFGGKELEGRSSVKNQKSIIEEKRKLVY